MTVKPFRGIRPDKKYVSLLNVPPYDVVSLEDVKKAVQDNPYSFFHITRAEADLTDLADEYAPEVYQKARDSFESFLSKKILIKDEKPSFYILSQTWKGRTQIGLYTSVSCQEYENNQIIKHELTRKDKEQDRTKHIETVKADTGPVFLFFEDNGEFINLIKPLLEKNPFYNLIDENEVENKLWLIQENHDISALEEYFQKKNAFYIADGHHRAASAVNVWKNLKNNGVNDNDAYQYFMAVVFPASQLKILPYNRAVLDLNGLSVDQFVSKLKENFSVRPASSLKTEKKGVIGMYIKKSFYQLTLKKDLIPFDPLESLDVSVLQKNVLSQILGIDDPRTSKRIQFVGGIKGEDELVRIVNSRKAKAAFSLFPVDINDVVKITQNHQIMPPKSTWFEPKLRDGLVVYSIE